MSELSPRARALFEAGRQSLKPTDADRERVLAAFSAGLAAPKRDVPSTPHATASAGGLGVPGVAAIVVGLAVAGAGLFAVLRPTARHAVAPVAASAPVVTTHSEAPSTALAPAPAASAQGSDSAPAEGVEPSRAAARPSAAAAGNDSLAEEVAILSHAERELHAEHYQSALCLLDEHRHRFPNGTLAQERMAARIQALCGLGRVSEAQAALARLTRLSPNSPHEEHARQACGLNH